jgi:hypothetical protein
MQYKSDYVGLIGKKIKGFKFKSLGFTVGYNSDMDYYIGQIGEITIVDTSSVCVKFNDGNTWCYPLPLVNVIEEEIDNRISEYYEI